MPHHEPSQRTPADRALFAGDVFGQGPIQVEKGDVIGVALLGLGGPSRTEEVIPFLYSRLMDPAEVDLRGPGFVRRRMARFLARRHGRVLTKAFELIGGTSPLRRHAIEQARALERCLNARLGAATGAEFRTYVAMRHGDPSVATARVQMDADGVTKSVLLPLEPHASGATTGSSLSYWRALQTDPQSERPTTLVTEYATHPKLIRAINERIDEGLQRFPREIRDRVQILFVGQGVPKRRAARAEDTYCCQVEATVRAVLADREDLQRVTQTAFLPPIGTGRALGLSVADALDDLSADGSAALLVVPISFISDRIETAFDLDVTARARAADRGVSHFEVTSGLNCHPLLVEALTESVAWHLSPGRAATPGLSQVTPAAGPTAPCPVCGRPIEARVWTDGFPPYTARRSEREAA